MGWRTGTDNTNDLCGVRRPSDNSIMHDSKDIFNASSREIIFRRAMDLSKGPSYTYIFEIFAAFDSLYKAHLSAGGTLTKIKHSHNR